MAVASRGQANGGAMAVARLMVVPWQWPVEDRLMVVPWQWPG